MPPTYERCEGYGPHTNYLRALQNHGLNYGHHTLTDTTQLRTTHFWTLQITDTIYELRILGGQSRHFRVI